MKKKKEGWKEIWQKYYSYINRNIHGEQIIGFFEWLQANYESPKTRKIKI